MGMKGDAYELTQAVKQLAKHQGAVLVGVASIERFDPQPPFYDAPPVGHGPRDYEPEAKSMISIAQPVLTGVMEAPAAMLDKEVEMVAPDARHAYYETLYSITGHRLQDFMLEQIAHVVGQYLQLQGYRAMFFPTAGIHPVLPNMTQRETEEGPSQKWAETHLTYKSRKQPFRASFGPFSHRHAAVRAGLGEFGYNNIVLTKEFGPRQRFNTIVTDAKLVPDPLITEPICLRDKCTICQKACPMGAITLRDKADKNRIFIDTPAITDPMLCNHRRERAMYPKACFYGDCNRICPIGKPKYLSNRLRAILEDWRQEGKNRAST